jgi:hypothetical protein
VVESERGLPYYEADNGYGIPVTFGDSGIPLGSASWWAPLFSGVSSGFVSPGFSNLGLLFQDSAGTTAVTTTGDPVGLAKDSSPNQLNLSQSSALLRPSYQANSGVPYLSFDGANDDLASTMNPTAAMTIAIACRTATASGFIIGGGASATSQRANIGLDASGRFAAGWGAQTSATIFGGVDIRNTDHVLILVATGTTVTLYVDGVSVYSAASSGSPAGSTSPMIVGAYNNNGAPTGPSAMRDYGHIVLPYAASASQVALINAQLARYL